jgi:hypothetical protein
MTSIMSTNDSESASYTNAPRARATSTKSTPLRSIGLITISAGCSPGASSTAGPVAGERNGGGDDGDGDSDAPSPWSLAARTTGHRGRAECVGERNATASGAPNATKSSSARIIAGRHAGVRRPAEPTPPA